LYNVFPLGINILNIQTGEGGGRRGESVVLCHVFLYLCTSPVVQAAGRCSGFGR
jgi:hypothetical protein